MSDVQARVVTSDIEHPTDVALIPHGLRTRSLIVQAWSEQGHRIDVRPEIVDEDTVRVYPRNGANAGPVHVVVIG